MVTYMCFSPVFGWLGDASRRWVLVGVAVIVWSLASGGSGPGDRLLDALLDALPGRDWRGGLRAGRAGDALGHVPGGGPRAGDGVVLPGDPGGQRPGVRDRRCRWRRLAGLAGGVLVAVFPGLILGVALLLHAGAAADSAAAARMPTAPAAAGSLARSCASSSRHPLVRALLPGMTAIHVRARRRGGVVPPLLLRARGPVHADRRRPSRSWKTLKTS